MANKKSDMFTDTPVSMGLVSNGNRKELNGEITVRTEYESLSKNLPLEAVQHAPKAITRKEYDSTGYSYQHVINRLNEVLWLNWGYDEPKLIKEIESKSHSGKPMYEVVIQICFWVSDNINGQEIKNTRYMVGGHKSLSYTDAWKGAMSNCLKKAAAMFGAGKLAYEGGIDDDLRMSVEEGNKQLNKNPKQGQKNPKQGQNPSPASNHSNPQSKTQNTGSDKTRNIGEILQNIHNLQKQLKNGTIRGILESQFKVKSLTEIGQKGLEETLRLEKLVIAEIQEINS